MKGSKIIQILVTLAYMLVSFSSCSNDKDEPKVSIPQDQTMTVGTTIDLKVGGSWTSSNTFVASVNNSGIVKAEHVGSCILENGKQSCRIQVSPKSKFITEPILEWGISKSEIISRCGSDYKATDNAIGYSTGIYKNPLIMYVFTNDKLSAAAILVSTNYTETLVDFLLERYAPLSQEGYDFYFANGLTLQQITTFVGLQLFSNDYWTVMYLPNKNSRSAEFNDYIMEEISYFM